MSLGKRLKDRREQLRMTQSQLASLLGITKGAVGNYENGVSSPKEEVLLKIFDVLKVEPNYLFQDSFTQGSFECSLQEQEFVQMFRKLDNFGKKAVQSLLKTEYERSNQWKYFYQYEDALSYLQSICKNFPFEKMDQEALIRWANQLHLLASETSDISN